jgi:hypothetical protein
MCEAVSKEEVTPTVFSHPGVNVMDTIFGDFHHLSAKHWRLFLKTNVAVIVSPQLASLRVFISKFFRRKSFQKNRLVVK